MHMHDYCIMLCTIIVAAVLVTFAFAFFIVVCGLDHWTSGFIVGLILAGERAISNIVSLSLPKR
jgi:hypothetical protein